MTHSECMDLMRPLVTKFGSTVFDSEKLNMIFENCQDLTYFEFKKIVRYFVGEDVRAKISDFTNQRDKVLRHRPQTSRREPEHCGSCADTPGLVMASLRSKPGAPYSFACSCNLDPGGLPIWSEQFNQEYIKL